MISGGLAGGNWALLLDCFKEIFEFVKSIISGGILKITSIISQLEDILNSPATTPEKGAAALLLVIILRHAWALSEIIGPAIAEGISALTWGLILAVLLIMTIITALYIFMGFITGKLAFESCRELINLA